MRHNRKWKTKRTEERKGREGKPATRAALLAKTTEMEALALQKRVDCIKTGEDDENVKDTLVAFFLRRCGLLLFCSFVLAMREKSTPQKVRKKTVKGENSVKIRNAKRNQKLEKNGSSTENMPVRTPSEGGGTETISPQPECPRVWCEKKCKTATKKDIKRERGKNAYGRAGIAMDRLRMTPTIHSKKCRNLPENSSIRAPHPRGI